MESWILRLAKLSQAEIILILYHMTSASYSNRTVLWKMTLSTLENLIMFTVLDFIQPNTLVDIHHGVKPV